MRHDAESREEMRTFYENQMENLRREQREALARLQEQHRTQIEEAVCRITKSFEEQISKLIAERDAALLAVKYQRGKRFGWKSERNKGDDIASRGDEAGDETSSGMWWRRTDEQPERADDAEHQDELEEYI